MNLDFPIGEKVLTVAGTVLNSRWPEAESTREPMFSRLATALRLLSIRSFRAKPSTCPMCGFSLLVKLREHPTGVRCVRCGGSAVHMSIAQALHDNVGDLRGLDVYEMSARGAFFEHLKGRCRSLTSSEYFDDVPAGTHVNGTQCQDVQRLTYSAASFDLCTSTEVFEHVPDDLAGFRELSRVLRPGGVALLTVPIPEPISTVVRARMSGGKIEHLLEPSYHGDRIRGHGGVLVFRDYGPDIVDRLRANGFSEARLVPAKDTSWWGLGCRAVLARK